MTDPTPGLLNEAAETTTHTEPVDAAWQGRPIQVRPLGVSVDLAPSPHAEAGRRSDRVQELARIIRSASDHLPRLDAYLTPDEARFIADEVVTYLDSP